VASNDQPVVSRIEETAQQQHIWDCQLTIKDSGHYVKIWYMDQKGKESVRTVIVKWVSERAFGGFCELRGAERVFLYESVNRMEPAG
jgi:hypothetical protein